MALIGLGMGATPHAQSLIELGHRVEVAAAFTRSPERAAAFGSRFRHATIWWKSRAIPA